MTNNVYYLYCRTDKSYVILKIKTIIMQSVARLDVLCVNKKIGT